MAIKFMDMISRISGVTIPVFGISWEPKETDREIIRKYILFLEDKRALTNPIERGGWNSHLGFVVQSVENIRTETNKVLQQLSESSKSNGNIKAMRRACINFLEWAGQYNSNTINEQYEEFFVRLGKLRASLGFNLAIICVMFGIDIEAELGSIIPEPEVEKEI